MANLITEAMRKLMLRCTLEIDNSLRNENLTCNICSKLIIDAYQTYCGCHYCRKCIVAYLADGVKYCRGGKPECTEEHLVLERSVFKNGMLDRRILKARVHCPNKPCPCITELTQMENHLIVCSQRSIECPFMMIGCDKEVSFRDEILTHIVDDSLKHSELLIELIHNIKNEVFELKDDFGRSKLEIVSLHKELRIKDVQMGNQKKEIDDLKKEIERLKGESENGQRMTDGVKKEVTNLKKEIVDVRECSSNIKNTVEMSERESKKYRNETRLTLIELKEETNNKVSAVNVTRSMNDVRGRVDEMYEMIEKVNEEVNTNVALFTVDRFRERKTVEGGILSPYFYSNTNGYKLRLRVFPGGCGGGRGTHLSIYMVICKGEYDDILPWPCRYSFTLGITNQLSGGSLACVTYNYLISDPKHLFDKPTDEDNRGLGNDTSVSHADLLFEAGLVVDDSVLVRCVVRSLS